MSDKVLNLAFIGGSIRSAVGTTHNIASRMDNRFAVVAGVFSLHEEDNMETARAWNIDKSRVYRNYQELLINEKGRIDAVVVLTPTTFHTDIVIDAIESGYPVICEKSLTASVDEAIRIKETFLKCKGFLAVTYNYTGYPMVREMRSLVQNGAVGTLSQIQIEMPQDSFIRVDSQQRPLQPQQWRLSDTDLPIVSTDLGVHLTNMISFVSNEKPVDLIAIQKNYGNFEVIDTVASIANYTNNLLCNIWFSKTALGYRNGLRIRIFGSKGSLMWYQMEPESLILTDTKGKTSVLDRANLNLTVSNQPRYTRFKAGHPAGYIEAFANCYCDMADALYDHIDRNEARSEYVFGIDHALNDIKVLDAMNNSARNNEWIKIE